MFMNKTYQVWAIGYDGEGCITDFDECLLRVRDSQVGKELCINYLGKIDCDNFETITNIKLPADVCQVELVVEYVTEHIIDGEAAEECTDVIEEKWIEIK